MRAVGGEPDGLLPDRDRALAVAEPREPAAEAAAFAGGEAVGDVELQVDGAGEAREAGVAGEDVVDEVRRLLEFAATGVQAGESVGAGQQIGLAKRLKFGVYEIARTANGTASSSDAPVTVTGPVAATTVTSPLAVRRR